MIDDSQLFFKNKISPVYTAKNWDIVRKLTQTTCKPLIHDFLKSLF
jgi:hypothetical protein